MERGLYLYCIAEGNDKITLGNIGIDNSEVYTIPCEDLCAIVHKCPSEPYKSEDNEVVKKWVMAHQKVIDIAWERFGTVLPLGFDTIIKGEEGIEPEENMKNWIRDDYKNLKQKFAKVRDRAEYGVQVFWDFMVIVEKIIENNPEIKKLNEEIKSKSKGLAYMYKQKLENLLKGEVEAEAERYFRDFYERIKRYADETKVEKIKKSEEGKQMLMNLSCLLPKDKSKVLGDELEKINNTEGFFVRFTGPWPPYSFV
ncbi:MAG: GvpL/GvpF family gas vesicle protein [Acidobacteriota bacterium]